MAARQEVDDAGTKQRVPLLQIAQRHVRVNYVSCPMWAYREAKNRGRLLDSAAPVPAATVQPNRCLDIFDGLYASEPNYSAEPVFGPGQVIHSSGEADPLSLSASDTHLLAASLTDCSHEAAPSGNDREPVGCMQESKDLASMLETFRLPLHDSLGASEAAALEHLVSSPPLVAEGSPLDSNLSITCSHNYSSLGSSGCRSTHMSSGDLSRAAPPPPAPPQLGPLDMQQQQQQQPRHTPPSGLSLNLALHAARTAPIAIASVPGQQRRAASGGLVDMSMRTSQSDPAFSARSSESGNCSLADSLQPSLAEQYHMLSNANASYSLSPGNNATLRYSLASTGSLDDGTLASSLSQRNYYQREQQGQGQGRTRSWTDTLLVTRIEHPDGTFKEVDPERASQLYRYRQAMGRMHMISGVFPPCHNDNNNNNNNNPRVAIPQRSIPPGSVP